LKPSNIMVGAFAEVQVMDWGLAKVLASPVEQASLLARPQPSEQARALALREADSRTLAGSIVGTPAYMPPEQARGEVERIDARAAVFGLGAILCEVLTGAPPFGGGDTSETLRQAAEGRLDAARERLRACRADAPLVELACACLDGEAD